MLSAPLSDVLKRKMGERFWYFFRARAINLVLTIWASPAILIFAFRRGISLSRLSHLTHLTGVQNRNLHRMGTLLASIVLACGSVARADIIQTFTVNTTNGQGKTVSASAAFDFSANQLSVTLTNTTDAATIAQILDGLQFSVVGGTISGQPSVSFIGGGNHFALCGTGHYPCDEYATDPNGGSGPYGWGSSTGAGTTCMNAGFTDCNGSWKPYGL